MGQGSFPLSSSLPVLKDHLTCRYDVNVAVHFLLLSCQWSLRQHAQPAEPSLPLMCKTALRRRQVVAVLLLSARTFPEPPAARGGCFPVSSLTQTGEAKDPPINVNGTLEGRSKSRAEIPSPWEESAKVWESHWEGGSRTEDLEVLKGRSLHVSCDQVKTATPQMSRLHLLRVYSGQSLTPALWLEIDQLFTQVVSARSREVLRDCENVNLGQKPGFLPQLPHFRTGWPWASYLPTVCLRHLTFRWRC